MNVCFGSGVVSAMHIPRRTCSADKPTPLKMRCGPPFEHLKRMLRSCRGCLIECREEVSLRCQTVLRAVRSERTSGPKFSDSCYLHEATLGRLKLNSLADSLENGEYSIAVIRTGMNDASRTQGISTGPVDQDCNSRPCRRGIDCAT